MIEDYRIVDMPHHFPVMINDDYRFTGVINFSGFQNMRQMSVHHYQQGLFPDQVNGKIRFHKCVCVTILRQAVVKGKRQVSLPVQHDRRRLSHLPDRFVHPNCGSQAIQIGKLVPHDQNIFGSPD